jgi:DNA excision repair protein ERCC-4
MREEWEKYLLGKAELHGLHKKKKKRQSQQPKGFGVLDGEFPAGPSENAGPVSIRNLETDALLAAASGISNLTKEADATDDSVASCRSGSVKGKGKGVSRKVPKRKASNRKTNNATENENCQGTDVEASGKIDEQSEIDVSKVSVKDVSGPSSTAHNASGPSSTAHNAEDLIDAKMLPPVQFYALDSDQHILDTWKPSVIIVYNPDITFVREIEVYKAENPSKKLRVYFLFYEESSEAQKFESSIRRENEAFESLIRQKSLMMIPVDQVVFQLNLSPLIKMHVP